VPCINPDVFGNQMTDEQLLRFQSKYSVTEPRPAPLNMTDKEILDWMNEYCDFCNPVNGVWRVGSEGLPYVAGDSIRDAVNQLAAYFQEANS
jgi:hypothetical protein